MRFDNKLGNSSKTRTTFPFQQGKKRPPAYLETLHHYPPGNPLFMAVDWDSLQWIHRLRGLCLLCNRWPGDYDLSCCFEREVWVLHRGDNALTAALRLAQAIQQSGAAEVVVIRLGQGE